MSRKLIDYPQVCGNDKVARYLTLRIIGQHGVRLYSQKQIEHLAKSIIDFRPKFVTLAHSQRHQQWSELEQVLAALSYRGRPTD